MKNKKWRSVFEEALSAAVKDLAREMGERPSKQANIYSISGDNRSAVGMTGSKKYIVKNAGML